MTPVETTLSSGLRYHLAALTPRISASGSAVTITAPASSSELRSG